MEPILSSAVLEVRRLRVDRAGQAVLRSVDLSLHEGARLGILGRNGAGKTTLVRTLVGLLPPQDGSVQVRGHAAGSPSAGVLTGWLPERPVLPPMPVHALLRTACALTSTRPDRIDTVVELLDLQRLQSRQARSLSQGEARLVALAMALVHDPALLVLDEPFTALDAHAREAVRRALAAHPRAAILLTAHEAGGIEGLTDRVRHLVGGHLQVEP